MSERYDCDVLVVGAGPTGLMTAILLARDGVDVRIVEKRVEPTSQSRAFVIQARTLEQFAAIGLDGPLFDEGVINTSVDLYVSGKLAGSEDFDAADAPDTPFKFNLMIPQPRIEKVLVDVLTRLGRSVERGREITGFSQDANGVRADSKHADGSVGRLRARYLVGGDGAHSTARHVLNLGFEGAKYAQSLLLADVKVEWPLDHDRFRVFLHGDRIGMFLPLNGSRMSRLITSDQSASEAQSDTPASTSDDIDLPTIEAAFAEAACLPVKLSDPQWMTRYRTHHRRVDRYRVGRVFVGGDAAHIHSPAGGQGMNTGLQDAANLAWKLTAVLHGADDRLLDTYESERLPVAEAVLNVTDKMFAVAAGQSGWKASVRDFLAPLFIAGATSLDAVKTGAFRNLSEIGIGYEASHAIVGPGTVKPHAGQRAPDARVNRSTRVFDLIAGYRFTLLALSRKPLSAEVASSIGARLRALEGPRVGSRLVARLSVGRQADVVAVEMVEVFVHYGLASRNDQALLLIRPDGYIAWRGDLDDVADCREVLARFALT